MPADAVTHGHRAARAAPPDRPRQRTRAREEILRARGRGCSRPGAWPATRITDIAARRRDHAADDLLPLREPRRDRRGAAHLRRRRVGGLRHGGGRDAPGPCADRLASLVTQHVERLTTGPYDLWFVVGLSGDESHRFPSVARKAADWRRAVAGLVDGGHRAGRAPPARHHARRRRHLRARLRRPPAPAPARPRRRRRRSPASPSAPSTRSDEPGDDHPQGVTTVRPRIRMMGESPPIAGLDRHARQLRPDPGALRLEPRPHKRTSTTLVALVRDKVVRTEGVILVEHDAATVSCRSPDTADHLGRKGMRPGAAAWASSWRLIAPPLLASVVVGGAVGGLVGKFAKKKVESGLEDGLGDKLPPGAAAIIAIVDERGPARGRAGARRHAGEVGGGDGRQRSCATSRSRSPRRPASSTRPHGAAHPRPRLRRDRGPHAAGLRGRLDA